MTTPTAEALLAVQKAREALRNKQHSQARQWAERAARLAPHLEEPWLVLAAIAGPRRGLQYIQRALQINPDSPRARRGMEWAMQYLRQPQTGLTETQEPPAIKLGATSRTPSRARSATRAGPRRSKRSALAPVALLALGSLLCAAAAWSATSSPMVASLIARPALASEPTHPPSWAQASIPKPTHTPAASSTRTVVEFPTPTSQQAAQSAFLSTDLPTEFPTPAPTATAGELEGPTAEPTWSGTLSMQYVPDTPSPDIQAHATAPTVVQPGSVIRAGGAHWIDVNLTEQMVYAYAGNTVVNSFLVSTGTWMTPTVTGEYKIFVKLRYTDMTGPDYYLPDVPYAMYFYKDFGLHGTYWHNNFGTPMSHGCVNLSVPDAEWLYDFSSVGTVVNVHY
jgi:lipoprotein-anchoring transpeptidase ErfK/SrfK